MRLGADPPFVVGFHNERRHADALAVFGYVKGRYTGAGRWKSAVQTTIVGGLAATAAYVIAKAIT